MSRITLAGYLNDTPQGFESLYNIRQQFERTGDSHILDFKDCQFLGQNAIAYLAGLLQLAKLQKRGVSLSLKGCNPKVKAHIEANALLEAFKDGQQSKAKSTSVPLRVNKTYAGDFSQYLEKAWLEGRIYPQHIEQILPCVLEVYQNVFDHARSPIGVSVCGQHYPNNETLKITLVDFGVGIPATVRELLQNPSLAPEDALRWAFESGNTTKREGLARGLGLKLLKGFIQRNHGVLEVYTDGALMRMDKTNEQFSPYAQAFGGTIVQITLMCDSKYYASIFEENSNEPLF